MSSLTVRRLVVWLVSLGLGFIVTWLIITVGFPIIKPGSPPVSLEKFGFTYFLVAAVPIGLIFLAWIDALVDSKIFPD